MRSRVLIGAGAWLLGALAATGGSMLAVNSLASGLLGSDTDQLSPAAVQKDLDGAHHSGSPSVGLVPSRGPSRSSKTGAQAQAGPTSAGTLLVSGAGSAMASCRGVLVYLLYWSPDQGYKATDVIRGPARQASLVFESAGTAVTMRVACRAGIPNAHLSGEAGDDDGVTGGDE